MNDSSIPTLATVVEHELKKLIGHKQFYTLTRPLWLLVDHCNNSFDLLVSPAPGGAYSYFGRMAVGEHHVLVSIKTVWGIIRHQSRSQDFVFEFCDPQFPDNLYLFIEKAATNSQRCFELAHTRMWQRYTRQVRLQDAK